MKPTLIIAIICYFTAKTDASWLDYFDLDYDYDYYYYYDDDYYYLGDSFGSFIKGQTVGGLWQQAPMDTLLTPKEFEEFEQGLLLTRDIGDKLQAMGCDEKYLDRTFVNVANTDKMVFEVYCNYSYHWILVDGMPPRDVQVFEFDPIYY